MKLFRVTFGDAGGEIEAAWRALSKREREAVERIVRPLSASHDRLRAFAFGNRAFGQPGLSAEARTSCAFLAVALLATKHTESMKEASTSD